MEEAAQEGASAIVLPELFLTGYQLAESLRVLAEPLEGPSLQRLAGLARRHRMLTVCGWPEAADGVLYNSACVIDADGEVQGRYRKTHLFGGEPEFFAPGDQLMPFDTSLGRIGVLICYDLEFPEPARTLALEGATLVVTSTASKDPYAAYQGIYARARAMENGVYVAAANTVGDLGPCHFFGMSLVVDPGGRVLAEADQQERLLFAPIDLSRVPPADPSVQYLPHRRPDLYARLTEVS
jgi:predicted amidohydrolase